MAVSAPAAGVTIAGGRATVPERVVVSIPLDPYLPLRALSGYCGLSIRKLRDLLTNPVRPLPCYRVARSSMRGLLPTTSAAVSTSTRSSTRRSASSAAQEEPAHD
jgi:hypothetical protein